MRESDDLAFPDHIAHVLIEHRGRGCIVDSVLMVMVAAAELDRRTLTELPRTRELAHLWPHIEFILSVLGTPRVITPNIATEVNGLIRNAKLPGVDPNKDNQFSSRRLAAMGRVLAVLTETYIETATLVADQAFVRNGLTDTSVIKLARDTGLLVFTGDGTLTQRLDRAGLPFLNIWHVKDHRGAAS